MLAGLFLALALAVYVEAGRNYNDLRLGRRLVFNDTGNAYTNTSATITSTTTRSSYTTLSTTSSTTSTTKAAVNSTSTTSSSETSSTTFTKSSGSETSGGESCAGLVTYYGSVPPTVYITVTEGFEVTVTASNASVTDASTLITPPPACQSTILPLLGTFQPLDTVEVSVPINRTTTSTKAAQLATTTTTRKIGVPPKAPDVEDDDGSEDNPDAGLPKPPPPAESPHLADTSHHAEFSIEKSTIYATAPYTSTVIVTKKTPVVVVSPQTSSPPDFQDTSPNQNNGPSNQNPGGDSPPAPNAPSNNDPNPPSNGPSDSDPDTPNNPPANSRPAPPSPSPGPTVGVPGPGATSAPVADVIVSLIRTQPFVPAPVAPSPTTINNVPVIALPSSILVGSSPIAIPQSSQVVATVNGQVFTVRPTELVAADTTIPIAAIPAAAAAPTFTTNVEVAPGITAQVAGSAAVIEGTTYRIGFGATPTTITVGGVPVGIGPYGLTLPSTTVAAPALTNAPMVVESVGDLTFSIDQSQVVVDGTTFRIGAGAPTITTEIDGQTLSIGPGGVGVDGTTTLKPTKATAASGSRSTAGGAMETDGAGSGAAASENAGVRILMRGLSMKETLGWLLIGGFVQLVL